MALSGLVHLVGYGMGNRASRFHIKCCKYLVCVFSGAVAWVPVELPDWAAERTSTPREVVEASLAHTVQNPTEAAYVRSDLFERRRRLMDDWAAYLDDKRSQVVPLRR